MKRLIAILLLAGLVSCSFNPLDPKNGLYDKPFQATRGPGVTATFLGNTTIHISDGTTDLLVDGYFTRPASPKVFIGTIEPNERTILDQLEKAGISKLDAVLVGHAHADHALDAPTISKMKNTLVMGNVSYRFYHKGQGAEMDADHLFTVPCHGTSKQIGKFKVTFVESAHIAPRSRTQKKIEGHITTPLKTPTPFSSFKCGDVYAIHLAHPDGNLLITTTAGAKAGALKDYRADVAFIGIGLLAKEPCCTQENYWKDTVEAVHAKTVVPVHWDNFGRQLDKGLKAAPWPIDDTRSTMDWLRSKIGHRKLLLMGLRDSIRLRGHEVQ